MIHYSIHFSNCGKLAAFTMHNDHGESEMEFILTATITRESAQEIIDIYGLAYVSAFLYNSPIHWIHPKSQIFKEITTGKNFDVFEKLKNQHNFLTHLKANYSSLISDHDSTTLNTLLSFYEPPKPPQEKNK